MVAFVVGCELHSNLVSLHSETTQAHYCTVVFVLWITFKSCIFAFWNNSPLKEVPPTIVVNYIQILYLCILKQQDNLAHCGKDCCELHSNLVSLHSETTLAKMLPNPLGCELHSNLVSLHSETTRTSLKTAKWLLWITFKSCIFAFWNNWAWHHNEKSLVVNYIQILYLCILKQPNTEVYTPVIVVNYIQILYLCILKQLNPNISLLIN